MFLSVTVFIVYLPTWLENKFSANSFQIALLFFIGGLATVFSGPISGRISDSSGRKSIIIISSILLVLMMPLTLVFLDYGLIYSYPVFFVIMLLTVGRMVPFQTLASEVVQDNSRGRVMALAISVGQIGMAIGSGISGFIYAEIGFLGNAIIGAAASLAMAILIYKYISEAKLVIVEKVIS